VKLKILVLEDEKQIRELLGNSLQKRGHEVYLTDSIREAIETANSNKIHLALIDIHLENSSCPETKNLNGIELLKELKKADETISCVIISSDDSRSTIDEALNSGADDFVQKPLSGKQLDFFLKKIEAERKLLQNSRSDLNLFDNSEIKIYDSKNQNMIHIYKNIKKLINTDLPILILGETGTGKEFLAKKIWENENDNSRAFIAINCSAIPEQLLESELFGFEKNAFSGASKAKAGLIELADGGDLFLDEISSMPKSLQAKILRVLQDKTVRRLGSVKERKVNFRCISATNDDLEDLVSQNLFRKDLLHRLRGVQFKIPSLKERIEDFNELTNLFVSKFSSGSKILNSETLKELKRYSWPGNIRELEQCIKTMVILSEDSVITKNDIPDWIKPFLYSATELHTNSASSTNEKTVTNLNSGDLSAHLFKLEKEIIENSIRNSKSISEASNKLGINRGSIDYKIRRHMIDVDSLLGENLN
jgi:DNA-binding NtrC family response regulator